MLAAVDRCGQSGGVATRQVGGWVGWGGVGQDGVVKRMGVSAAKEKPHVLQC